MQSQLSSIMKPSIAALLDVIDETMNSNTMLLKVQAEKPLTISNCRDELRNFLRSPLFTEMVIEIDQQREFYNYTLWDIGADGMPLMHPPSGNLVKDHFELVFTPMDECQFAKRLHWMLREAHSPHQTHTTEQHAQEVIRDFFWEVFTPESWPLDNPSAQAYWSAHPWFFSDVKPDFLYSNGYYEDLKEEDIPPFAYFDGGKSDTCTFFYEENIFYLLFTNGSP